MGMTIEDVLRSIGDGESLQMSSVESNHTVLLGSIRIPITLLDLMIKDKLVMRRTRRKEQFGTEISADGFESHLVQVTRTYELTPRGGAFLKSISDRIEEFTS